MEDVNPANPGNANNYMRSKKMNEIDLLRRYLHLGSDHQFFIRKNVPLDMVLGRKILAFIEKLPEDSPPKSSNKDGKEKKEEKPTSQEEKPKPQEEPKPPRIEALIAVEKAITRGTTPRLDESLFTLAFLMRHLKSKLGRCEVYKALPRLISSSKDLFQLMYFHQLLAPEGAGKGFGNGLKRALTTWYEQHSAEALAKLLASDRGAYGWCHKDIVRMAHIKLADSAKMHVMDEYLKMRKSKKADEASATGAEGSSEALRIYRSWKKFKASKTAQSACAGIKEHKYPLELVPPPLLRAASVWECLFPHMNYRDVIQVALALQDARLLKDTDTPLSIAYGKVLNRMTSVTKSKISPIFVYQVKRLFEERQRYLNVVKEVVHRVNNLGNLYNENSATPNRTVQKHMDAVLNQALFNWEKTGRKILVTIDVQSKLSKKRICGNRLMSCMAAYLLLVLPLLKTENNVNVVSFSEEENELNEVNFDRVMDFGRGFEYLQRIAKKKTKAAVTEPIAYATKRRLEVDVFIVIVDSLIRVNPKRTSPIEELRSYSASLKRNVRYIVVNLCRHQQDFKHLSRSDGGTILELAGCWEDTPKVMNAFITGAFD